MTPPDSVLLPLALRDGSTLPVRVQPDCMTRCPDGSAVVAVPSMRHGQLQDVNRAHTWLHSNGADVWHAGRMVLRRVPMADARAVVAAVKRGADPAVAVAESKRRAQERQAARDGAAREADAARARSAADALAGLDSAARSAGWLSLPAPDAGPLALARMLEPRAHAYLCGHELKDARTHATVDGYRADGIDPPLTRVHVVPRVELGAFLAKLAASVDARGRPGQVYGVEVTTAEGWRRYSHRCESTARLPFAEAPAGKDGAP